MKKLALILLVLIVGTVNIVAQESLINSEDSPIQFFAEYEGGFLALTGHTIQIGTDGDGATNFDYVTQGGQDILFPFERFTVGALISDRHRVSFLYQPLEINTQLRFREDVKVDGVTFLDGTVMNLKYGFPFYRVTYTYDLLEDEDKVLALGAALQIRNASIVFASSDGEQLTISQNVGPVPALSLYSRYEFDSGLNLTADVTGLYASSAIINGANFQFEGSILDASLRMGYDLKNKSEIYGNLRFLGGSASGTSQYDNSSWSESVERFTDNRLGTLTVSVGLAMR